MSDGTREAQAAGLNAETGREIRDHLGIDEDGNEVSRL